ncbi:hypothetical protein AU106_gp046 [Sinorhizobium phage phiM9]|uniref:Uncharacterized protein n=1 Tax=Sinorhizobium phage phiM9 TaxID=1636182 RepID=A0A0F6R4W0_9CAUD|nr:hypothetical protein AU106_gp046 [Sinorhizobium phage phiM9]AKE44677.1 hypothetical protein Sm_phiM9_047 [Sinorhizobium phage phiM9]
MNRIQLETKLGLAEFSLSNTRDPIHRIRLINYINELKIALEHY